jgi:hypothetical protein
MPLREQQEIQTLLRSTQELTALGGGPFVALASPYTRSNPVPITPTPKLPRTRRADRLHTLKARLTVRRFISKPLAQELETRTDLVVRAEGSHPPALGGHAGRKLYLQLLIDLLERQPGERKAPRKRGHSKPFDRVPISAIHWIASRKSATGK